MLKQECRKGMRVLVGRPNGEKTLCEIERLNPKTAVVVTLESRGMYRDRPPGHKIRADYSFLWPAPADAKGEEPKATVVEHKITYSPFQHAEDVHILLAMHAVYGALSPENLSCDGELPRQAVIAKAAALNRKLRHLQQALGTPVDEGMVSEWKQSYDAAMAERKRA